jgi:hypothetical protein
MSATVADLLAPAPPCADLVPCAVFPWCLGHADGADQGGAGHCGEAVFTTDYGMFLAVDEGSVLDGVASVAGVWPFASITDHLHPDEAEAVAALLIEFAKAARTVDLSRVRMAVAA